LRQYLRDHPEGFDAETIDILVSALDEGRNVVEANKAAYKIEGHAAGTRAALAMAIVDMAKQGELDRQRLIEGALAELKGLVRLPPDTCSPVKG
jgi:hypothetical protein